VDDVEKHRIAFDRPRVIATHCMANASVISAYTTVR